LFSVLAAMSVEACSKLTGPGVDAHVARRQQDAAIAGGAVFRGSCGWSISICPNSENATSDDTSYSVLLDASDFGTDARVIAIDGAAALVEGGDAPWRVAYIYLTEEAATKGKAYATLAAPAGDLRPLDVADGVFVLACSTDKARCLVLRGTPEDGSLSEWAGTELPPGFVPRGIVVDKIVSPGVVCVYGNGLLCFDGGWQIEIAPELGLQLNDVAVGYPPWIAVGAHGRYFVRTRSSDSSGRWLEQPRVGDVELTRASAQNDKAVVIGKGGLWVTIDTQQTPPSVVSCTASEALSMVNVWQGVADGITAVTASGQVLRHVPRTPSTAFCAWASANLGDNLGGTINRCGIEDNERVFSAEKVVGLNFCARGF
jgi:hypothetical protein